MQPLGNDRIEHVEARVHQLVHHLVSHSILKIKVFLQLLLHDFVSRALELLLGGVSRLDLVLADTIFVEPLLKVELEGLHDNLRVIDHRFLLDVGVRDRHSILELQAILRQQMPVLRFEIQVDLLQLLQLHTAIDEILHYYLQLISDVLQLLALHIEYLVGDLACHRIYALIVGNFLGIQLLHIYQLSIYDYYIL